MDEKFILFLLNLDPEFLENSQDAERCLTYVLLDKALLCCLVVLERKTSDKQLVEFGRKYETTVQELEVIRQENKSLKRDNERLVGKLGRRRSDTTVPDSQSVEALLIRNSELKLEVKTLQKKLGSKRHDSAGTGSDIEMAYWRERVGKLTKENEKLEFMMKVMGDRFSQEELVKKPTREAHTQVGIYKIARWANWLKTSVYTTLNSCDSIKFGLISG